MYAIYCDLVYHIFLYGQKKDFTTTKMLLSREDLFDEFPADRGDDLDKVRRELLEFFEEGNAKKDESPTKKIQAWFISFAQYLFFTVSEQGQLENDPPTRRWWREEMLSRTGKYYWLVIGWSETAWEEGMLAPGWEYLMVPDP